MSRYTLTCGLVSLLLCACPGRHGGNDLAQPAPPENESAAQPSTARLVLVVVLDQMPSDALLRYAAYLPEDGALRRAIDDGLFEERVRYGYAGTNTAPGHASIFTGELPADHGIDSNDVFDHELAKKVRVVHDGEHAVFGVEGAFASPWRLLKPTVGDQLHAASARSKVVSVSLKARAAVVSGGKTADFVAWYDPTLPGFTTSSYYAEAVPAWLGAWNLANPVADRMTPWTAGNPTLYEEVSGPDQAPGESDWHGLGTTFPHDASSTERPTKTFTATPQSVRYLLDLTRAAIEEFELGRDEHPDLLSVSISTTDYAGHTFGSHSWEYMDVLLKADKELGALVDELRAQTELAVVVTSDHGGTPLVEERIARGLPGGRLGSIELVAELEALADEGLGEGDWIEAYIQPYLYLSKAAKASAKHEALVALISKYAADSEAVNSITPAEVARSWRNDDNWLRRDIANTVAAQTEALFVVPAEGYVASSRRDAQGTGHGTPWDPDREVPVLAFGTGVGSSHGQDVVAQNRVAATIAALLGLDWHLDAESLHRRPSSDR